MTPAAASLVGVDAVRDAAEAMRSVVRRTPLLRLDALSDAVGVEVRVKCENLQRAGAFKLRGAYNFIRLLTAEQRKRGVVTFSSGNHGQGVALAAQLMGIPATVVMPSTAPQVKIDNTREFGATVIFVGPLSLERKARAEAIAAETGAVIVPPYDHADIVAGQGTATLEILEDFPEVGRVVLPIGGGGLISGGVAATSDRADVRICGAEPQGAPKASRALAEGRIVTLESTASIADGLITQSVGHTNFAHIHASVERVVTLSEDEIVEGVKHLAFKARLVAEPSGATALAAVLSGKLVLDGPTAILISGGNVDPQRYAAWLVGSA